MEQENKYYSVGSILESMSNDELKQKLSALDKHFKKKEVESIE
jgi:hypothetical protein